jgi:hypothetical protein
VRQKNAYSRYDETYRPCDTSLKVLKVGRQEVQPYISLTSALDGGEWSTSHPRRFTPGERAPDTIWQEAGWTPVSVWTQRWWREKFLAPALSSPCTDWAIPTPPVSGFLIQNWLPISSTKFFKTQHFNQTFKCIIRSYLTPAVDTVSWKLISERTTTHIPCMASCLNSVNLLHLLHSSANSHVTVGFAKIKFNISGGGTRTWSPWLRTAPCSDPQCTCPSPETPPCDTCSS